MSAKIGSKSTAHEQNGLLSLVVDGVETKTETEELSYILLVKNI